MKIYHYTNSGVWNTIQARPDGTLQPSEYRVIRNPESGKIENALFSFQDPAPYEWIMNRDFSGEFNFIVSNKCCAVDPTRQFACIAADVTENKLWVSDYAEYLRRDMVTRVGDMQAEEEAVEAYFGSVIPLRDYRRGKYELPEVICFSSIPKNRLTLVEAFTPTNEKLDDYLARSKALALKAYRDNGERLAAPCFIKPSTP